MVNAEQQKKEPDIVRCKDCIHYIPYEWKWYDLPRSNNIEDYDDDEIGCDVNETHYPPDGFCSYGKRDETRQRYKTGGKTEDVN